MTRPEHRNATDAITMVLTDADGVIEALCPSLEALIGRSATEVTGSPLALLLHPQQPTGLAIWLQDTLESSGMAASFQHLANRHGASLWQVSLAVKWPGGVMHIGFPPSQPAFRLQAERIYRAAADSERRALEAGLSRDAATALGAESIGQHLADLGFSSFSELEAVFLPAEAANHPAANPVPPDGVQSSVWEAAFRLHTLLIEASGRYEKLHEAARLMAGAAQSVQVQGEPMAHASTLAIQAAAEREVASATLLTAAHRMRAAASDATVKLMALASSAGRAQELVAEQRAALAGATMLSEAVLETLQRSRLDNTAPVGSKQPDARFLEPLMATLESHLPRLSMGAARIGATMARLTKEAIETAGQLRAFGSSLASWRLLASRFGLPTWLWPEEIDPETTASQIDGLRDLARGASSRVGVPAAAAASEAVASLNRALRMHATTRQSPVATPPVQPTRAVPRSAPKLDWL
ncbi:MAG: PAS domain-containing protein [Micrococcales bacterium]|nr:PAS domain-containing protein [Micrococcales bacterium]